MQRIIGKRCLQVVSSNFVCWLVFLSTVSLDLDMVCLHLERCIHSDTGIQAVPLETNDDGQLTKRLAVHAEQGPILDAWLAKFPTLRQGLPAHQPLPEVATAVDAVAKRILASKAAATAIKVTACCAQLCFKVNLCIDTPLSGNANCTSTSSKEVSLHLNPQLCKCGNLASFLRQSSCCHTCVYCRQQQQRPSRQRQQHRQVHSKQGRLSRQHRPWPELCWSASAQRSRRQTCWRSPRTPRMPTQLQQTCSRSVTSHHIGLQRTVHANIWNFGLHGMLVHRKL